MKMSEEATIIKGMSWGVIGEIIVKLISFLYVIILAQLFIPEYLGEFYLVISILSMLEIFSDLGIIGSMNRYLPYFYGKKEFKKVKALLKLELFIPIILSLLLYSLVFLFSEDVGRLYGNENISSLLRIMGLYFIINTIFRVGRVFLLARKNIKASEASWVVQNFSKLTFTVLLIKFTGSGTYTLALAYLGSFFMAALTVIFFDIKELKKIDLGEEKEGIEDYKEVGKNIAHFGIMTVMINSFWSLASYLDRLIIGYILEPNIAMVQVAVYSIAIGLGTLIVIFQQAILRIFFPTISGLIGTGDEKKIKKTIDLSIKWLLLITIPVTIVVILFARNFILLFFGEEYVGGEIVVILFTLGLIIKSLSTVPGSVLMAMNKLNINLIAAASAMTVNVILDIVLIPIYGINGAAFASAISFTIVTLILLFYSRKIYGFKFPKEAYTLLIAGIIVFGILFLIKPYIWAILDNYVSGIELGAGKGGLYEEILKKAIKIIIFGALFLITFFIYLLALVKLKSFESEELNLFNSGLKKIKIPEKLRTIMTRFLRGEFF